MIPWQFTLLGYEKIVQNLLETNVDINDGDTNGNTALIFATKQGYLNIVQILIEHGVDLNLEDENGFTALHWAAFKGRGLHFLIN